MNDRSVAIRLYLSRAIGARDGHWSPSQITTSILGARSVFVGTLLRVEYECSRCDDFTGLAGRQCVKEKEPSSDSRIRKLA